MSVAAVVDDKSMDMYLLILIPGFIGVLFAAFQFWLVSRVSLESRDDGMQTRLIGASDAEEKDKAAGSDRMKMVVEIYGYVRDGAKAFLAAEYKICLIFIVLFGALVLAMVSHAGTCTLEGWEDIHINKVNTTSWDFASGGVTAASFAIGGLTSILSGYIGMMVAVYSNARTTVSAWAPENDVVGDRLAWKNSFNTAFRAGGVMGFSLAGIGLIILFIIIQAFTPAFPGKDGKGTDWAKLMEAVAGFGLGGSSIALFGRVGGGIYTKAADVGADLAGKVIQDLDEDSPRNPATIADNVGDNVGDVAGMGSDLFGSFAEATCAALVVGASSTTFSAKLSTLLFPLYISAAGIVMCMLTSFLATNICPVKKEADVEKVLKVQLFVSTALMTAVMYPICSAFLPHDGVTFESVPGVTFSGVHISAFVCIACGLWGGCIIGFITEYYTSHSYTPVREVSESCKTGAATNIIYGLALGYKSAIIPVTIIAAIVFASFKLLNMYGVALAALGMLGTLATCLSIDVYGPVCDNAGGIAEMAELPKSVRERTDALDAAGNTTAAIGKGFAIGSAALVSLALFGGFVTRAGRLNGNVQLLEPITFAFLVFGAMLPYWFSAMTMKSVGLAAFQMVKEVERQFKENPDLLDENSSAKPDHDRCIKISTDASLREMILPGLLVMLSPILTGVFFGVSAVSGLLAGGMSSGVQLALSMSNTGGAWDNAKKYVEKGCVLSDAKDGEEPEVLGKGSEVHKAAVTGDTVGDPLKDTSGPALNILMKLMAIISLVFAQFFMSINDGQGVFLTTSVSGLKVPFNGGMSEGGLCDFAKPYCDAHKGDPLCK